MALDMRYPTPLPSTKGWGPGWPNCSTDKIVQHPIFQGGVHKDILDLTDMLVAEMQERGYRFHDGWSWGYGCRATKGGSGDVPSFHSWGLALDINAPINVFGGAASSSDINVNTHWIVGLMAEYGFFWLGPPIGDWMHFSFVGSPADAEAMTTKARKDGLGMPLTPEEKAALNVLTKFYKAVEDTLAAAGPTEAGKRIGKATKKVEAGGDAGPHTHAVTGTAQ